MKDRIPKYPGRVTLTPVEGQANTFDMIRADEPEQEGTPLNKATLLTNETASLFGLGEDATVDEVLSIAGESLNSLTDSVFSGCSMVTFNYTGTGTSERKTFTVGGKPLMAFVFGGIAAGTTTMNRMELVRGNTYARSGYNTQEGCSASWGDTSVSFNVYNGANSGNLANYEYTVLIIFEPKQFDGEIALTVTLPDGTPCAGLSVNGVYTKLGAPVATDKNGAAKGFGVNGETVSVSAPMVDLADMSFTIDGLTKDSVTSVAKAFSILESVPLLTYTESGTITFYGDHEVSLSLIGGGSGGDGGEYGNGANWDGASGGNGGSGGKIFNTNASLTGGVEYTVVIGAGGYGGVGGLGYYQQAPTQGNKGGDTTFSGFSSASGSTSTLSTLNAALGGNGGKGGNGGSYDEEYDGWNGLPEAGQAGTRKGGKGGTTPEQEGADGGDGKNGTHGGGGGGGSGGGHAWYSSGKVTVGNGGDGGRGGSGVLLIQIL